MRGNYSVDLSDRLAGAAFTRQSARLRKSPLLALMPRTRRNPLAIPFVQMARAAESSPCVAGLEVGNAKQEDPSNRDHGRCKGKNEFEHGRANRFAERSPQPFLLRTDARNDWCQRRLGSEILSCRLWQMSPTHHILDIALPEVSNCRWFSRRSSSWVTITLLDWKNGAYSGT